jgi:hypothetical protein
MQNFNLETHIGADGILHLNLPVAVKNTDMRVTVVCKPVATRDKIKGDFAQLWAALAEFPADFMTQGREQPAMQKRENLF